MRLHLTILAVFSFCFYPSVTKAEFGLGPCCSGATCGIIPCDSMCAGPALTNFGSSFSSKLESIGGEHQSLTDRLSDVTRTATDLYADIGQQSATDSQNVLIALDGFVSKFDMSIMQSIKAFQTQYEVVVNAFVQGLKSTSKINSIAENARMFGAQSVSQSFKSLVNSSETGLTVLNTHEKSVGNLNSLLMGAVGLKHEIESRNLRSGSHVVAIDSEFPLAVLATGGMVTDLTPAELTGKMWPFVEHLEKSGAVQLFSFLVAGNVQVESGRTYNEMFESPSIDGVSKLENVTEIYGLNDYGLNRQIAVNNQLSNALLSQLVELRRARNSLMARGGDNAL